MSSIWLDLSGPHKKRNKPKLRWFSTAGVSVGAHSAITEQSNIPLLHQSGFLLASVGGGLSANPSESAAPFPLRQTRLISSPWPEWTNLECSTQKPTGVNLCCSNIHQRWLRNQLPPELQMMSEPLHKALLFNLNAVVFELFKNIFSSLVGPQGIWWRRDRSQSSSSSPSSPWSPSWSPSGAEASGQTRTACSSSAASQWLCYWWCCGRRICGTTQCCVKSTQDSFTYQSPGPTTHYISARTINLHIHFKKINIKNSVLNDCRVLMCSFAIWKTKDWDESVL